MNVTNEQLDHLQKLAASPMGRVLIQILEAEQQEIDDALRTVDAPNVFRQQGRSQRNREILKRIQGAQKALTSGETLRHRHPTDEPR